MKNKFEFLYKKYISVFLYIVFLIVNLYYFTNNFFLSFLNKGWNGDEYYEGNLYTISNVTLEKIFSTPSQPYVFISSCVNFVVNSPKMATRVVSLAICLLLILFFIKKINSGKGISLEEIYKSTLFICSIFITNQMFIGTSDFFAFVLIVLPLLIIIENISTKKINLNVKQSVIVGIFFGLSVATRPTSLVLIASFYITLFLILGYKRMFCRENYIIAITSLVILFTINFVPLVEQHKIIFDIKEVPKETGVNWFQRNYLMAKYWDSNKIPHTQWISTQEVIDYKKANPNFDFPKNQIDLLIKEPGLYFRQMIRMFVKGLYSSYRYMYLLFPLLFLSFIKNKKLIGKLPINNSSEQDVFQNIIIVVFHLLSIIIFSFLAVKLFEFRWVIPSLILYTYFAINYLSKFPEKVRFLVYNLSFMSGIVMYILFFITM